MRNGFLCEISDGIRLQVNKIILKNGLVPAITVCSQRLYENNGGQNIDLLTENDIELLTENNQSLQISISEGS